MNIRRIIATTLSLCLYMFVAAQTINIIPQPQKVELNNGYFTLNGNTAVCYNNPQLRSIAGFVSSRIESFNKLQLPVKVQKGTGTNSKSINLVLDSRSNTINEGYLLKVAPDEISIRASTSRGIFYGVQSLLQLIPVNNDKQIPSVIISDQPRFGWRGLLLDVSRHFFTIEEVKELIDQMVVYKFNLLQLHLTDDQGWRIEIKSLPELTQIGAWRVPRTGLWWDRECPKEGEKPTYGGFYTQEEIKDLVRYGADRFVDILPEIEAPGHSLAAIASYPYLSSEGKNCKVNPGCKFYGIEDNSLCPGKESTFEYMDKVFTEVAALFPFEYIHIGGDECFKGFWEKCEHCQKRMKDNGLKDVKELQSYFVKRLEKILQDKGKKLIGWDEILEGGLAPNATVMSWRGMEGGIAAAKAEHHVVMCPYVSTYLDFYQGDPSIEPPTYEMLRLDATYAFEPVPEGVDSTFILGGQGNLWTESVPTFRHAEYMIWPRALALAEVFWSQKSARDWPGFVSRTEVHLERLAKADINFSRSFYEAVVTPLKDENGNLLIRVNTQIKGLKVYYTFDNTYPDTHSKLYKDGEKLSVPEDADTFRVVTYRDGNPAGRILTIPLADLSKRLEVN